MSDPLQAAEQIKARVAYVEKSQCAKASDNSSVFKPMISGANSRLALSIRLCAIASAVFLALFF